MDICHFVVVLCLMFMQAQIVLSQECSTCQCCAVGQYAPCTMGGYCNNGCIDGYYGGHCINKCITPNCKSCYQSIGSNSCSECKSGYYLNNYKCYNCGSQCRICASYSCLSCYDGYWGDTCENSCNESCASCQKLSGNCLTCDPGYYVYNGKCNTCDTHCAVCGATWCSSCYDGYWGKTCENSCNDSCASCRKSNGYCLSCEPGYYVNNGKCNTCDTHCAVCGATWCSSCYNGYWGNTCEIKCHESCVSCLKLNGECLSCEPGYYVHNDKCNTCDTHCVECGATWCSSCYDGYWGDTCEHNCNESCASCLKWNGDCLSCKPGYRGSTCEERCVEYCLECDRLNGNCISCDKGHWGYSCDACNVQCKICNQSYGCLECKVGYYGQTCDKDCGAYCQDCDRTNGCLQCLPGYYKHNNMCAECSYRSNGCTCTSNVQCSGCVDGYFLNPSLCSKCPEYCSNCNKSSLSGQTVCTSCTAGTFGETCQYICSQDCENGYCDEKNPDETCSQCANGRFGEKCEHFCSLGCESRNCTKETGSCTCKAGWNGQRCQTFIQTKTEKPTTSLSPAALGGGIGGGIVALSAIGLLVLFLLRRRKVNLRNTSKTLEKEPENLSALYATVNKGRASTAEYTFGDSDNFHSVTIIESPNPPPNRSGKETAHILTEDNLEIDEDDASARELAVIFEENGGVYYNNAEKFRTIKLPVTDLPRYVLNICLKDLEKEFQKIPYGLVKAYGVSQTNLNMQSNRYKGIYPYDESRVIVRGGETDYINASYIDGFRRRNTYIATLGPMAKQLGDFGQFWRMVWQQEVEKIVMVTSLVESKNIKCEQYWPDHHQSKLYGDIEIVCKVEKLYADFIWRQFTLSQNSEERSLHHLQFTGWPDKDIPDDVTSIIDFRQRVNALPSTLDGPVVVHCSAGVGRTGTYIALDILTKEGEVEGTIDIPGCVLNMRQNRPNMIQTLSQYKYLHQALVYSLTLECSVVKREHFHEYMEKSGKEEIKKQFEKMKLVREQKSDKEVQAMERNRLLTKKNRKHADIPGDSSRPRLYLYLQPGEPDYINAIYIDSLKTKHRFLVAQTPLPDTVADFITLAVQENCSCIVSMEAHLENHIGKDIGLYFPGENQTMKAGVVSVRSTTDQSSRHFVKRMLHFEHEEKTKKDVTIPHYEYLDWDTKHNVPNTPEHFVAFIKEVEDVSKSSHPKGPILVHCLNGAEKSGIFCVVSTLIETLSEANEVSVVNVVMKVRARRPLAIPNKEQFYFCHECVLHSVNATDNAVYYNISGDIQRE